MIVYYEHGQVVKTDPIPDCPYYEIRDLINEATSIISDGISYDLTSVDSIRSIHIPEYIDNNIDLQLGVTGYLEYVLRMHAGLCWNNAKYDLAIACLEKATLIMKDSSIQWDKRDFYRIVRELRILEQYERANHWSEWIKKTYPILQN